jgi:hypothetical protein
MLQGLDHPVDGIQPFENCETQLALFQMSLEIFGFFVRTPTEKEALEGMFIGTIAWHDRIRFGKLPA